MHNFGLAVMMVMAAVAVPHFFALRFPPPSQPRLSPAQCQKLRIQRAYWEGWDADGNIVACVDCYGQKWRWALLIDGDVVDVVEPIKRLSWI